MIELVFLINRVDGTSVEEFVAHHRDEHAPLFTSIPEAERHVRRYAVSHPVPAQSYPAPAYDGLTEIWFDRDRLRGRPPLPRSRPVAAAGGCRPTPGTGP